MTDIDHVNAVRDSRLQLLMWLTAERQRYSDVKYSDKKECDSHIQEDGGIGDDSWYWGFIGNYLKRAQLMGLDQPNGRQALGKAIVTLMDALESSIRVFGPMPQPGVPSGEIDMSGKRSQ